MSGRLRAREGTTRNEIKSAVVLAEIDEPVVLNQTEAELVEPARATEQVAWKLVIVGEVDGALESDVEGLKPNFVAEGVEIASERAEPFVETLLALIVVSAI